MDSRNDESPAPPAEAAPAREEEAPAADARPVDDEARREEIRLAVERARAEMASAKSNPAPELDPEEARREEVRRAVERARGEMFSGRQQEPSQTQDEDERRREEVRRTVESARSSMSWGEMKSDAGTWGQFQPEPGGFTIGPDQAPPHSMEPAAAADDEAREDLDPEEARREEVRRAVEAARAEMMQDEPPPPPRIVPLVPAPGSATPRGADFNGPPVIVIEDPSGRVELSQVFATLSRVDRSSQAALLNYSPHSVTIGLNMMAPVPSEGDLQSAAQAVFGRECSVRTDGSRTAIEIGTRPVYS
jgi:hypothetical protein